MTPLLVIIIVVSLSLVVMLLYTWTDDSTLIDQEEQLAVESEMKRSLTRPRDRYHMTASEEEATAIPETLGVR